MEKKSNRNGKLTKRHCLLILVAIVAVAFTAIIVATNPARASATQQQVRFAVRDNILQLSMGEELVLREEKKLEGKRVKRIQFEVLEDSEGLALLLRKVRRGTIYIPSLEPGVYHGYIEIGGKKFETRYKVDVIVRIDISGTLAPLEYDAYDPLPMYSAFVYVEWTPGDQPILIGVLDADVGKGYGHTYTGGFAAVTLTYPYNYSHSHYIIIGNLGTETITYKGYIDWWVP